MTFAGRTTPSCGHTETVVHPINTCAPVTIIPSGEMKNPEPLVTCGEDGTTFLPRAGTAQARSNSSIPTNKRRMVLVLPAQMALSACDFYDSFIFPSGVWQTCLVAVPSLTDTQELPPPAALVRLLSGVTCTVCD